jgi:hypothetical protein
VKRAYRFSEKAWAVFVATVAILLATTPGASAGTREVCNSAFCNVTSGNEGNVSSVRGTKRAPLIGVRGFFEAYGPGGMKSTGPTTTARSTSLTSFKNSTSLKRGELMCLRFFEKRGNQYFEMGTAQCTTAPF